MRKSKLLWLTLATICFITQGVPATAKTSNPKANQNAQINEVLNITPQITTVKKNNERQIISINGKNMSYIQLGNVNSNKSIVIIHGTGYNALSMVPYGELYAKEGYNVILIDLPGHYNTEAPSDITNNLEELGNDTANLMNELVKEKKLNNKSEIQGWSLGGSIALDIAIRHPEVVNAVGLINSSSNWNGMELNMEAITEENKVNSMKNIITSLKSEIVPQEITNKLISEVPDVIAPVEAINNDYIINKSLNIDESIGQIKVPVYDFYGNKNTLTSIDKQNEMIAKIKHSKLYIAEGYNYFAVLENPQLVFDSFKSMQANGTGNGNGNGTNNNINNIHNKNK